MADTISVKAAKEDGKVAFWEKDDAHPDGEAYVVGDGAVHTVANTGAVKRALSNGLLVETSGAAPTPFAAPKPTSKPVTP